MAWFDVTNGIKQKWFWVFSLGFLREPANRAWTSGLPVGGAAFEVSWPWYYYFLPTKTFHVTQGMQILGADFLGQVFFFFKDIFISFRERACRGRARERGRKNAKQTPYWAWSLMWGSIPQPWDHDPSGNQELDAKLTEPPRRPSWTILINSCTYTKTA